MSACLQRILPTDRVRVIIRVAAWGVGKGGGGCLDGKGGVGRRIDGKGGVARPEKRVLPRTKNATV